MHHFICLLKLYFLKIYYFTKFFKKITSELKLSIFITNSIFNMLRKIINYENYESLTSKILDK
jgi:hypothetical protein